jgi:tRNA pseudouridine55 synthase
MTSRRAVDCVQRVSCCRRVGHAGTLDPLASGVLMVCVGQATRLIEYVQQLPKRYAATFLLGRHSPTEDMEGEVTELAGVPVPTLEQLAEAARGFTGEISQRPPAFSALKIAGRRAYELARRGLPVELEPRTITIYRLAVVGYDYPELRLDIECSSGTYVRSLGRDLAESLGTAAVMSGLVRTAIGPFGLSEAVLPDQLTSENWTSALLPPRRAVEQLPQVELSDEQAARLRNGQTIACAIAPTERELAAVDVQGELVALLAMREPGWFRPTRVFHNDP